MEALFEAGVLFCITSNYHPDALYPNGLQRELFLPAIELLKERLDVIEIDSGVDYRLRSLAASPVYHTPADAEAEQRMLQTFGRICGGEGHMRPIHLLGREVSVVRRAPGVAWFDFATLCGGHRSQHDYLDLAHQFHTVFLSGVPVFTKEGSDAARRFTWLVDVLYDHKVKLVLSASAPVEALDGQHSSSAEFARTVSRLIEMRSRNYLTTPHRRYETHGHHAAVTT
jgi:cell division protein ZapE